MSVKQHHLRHIPNAITIARLVLVLPIAFSIMEEDYLVAFVLFAVSGFSDGLDGFIARRYNWVSAFGRLIDPLADKIMMIVTTLTLGLLEHFPLMLMLLIIVKDLAVLGGVFSYTTMAGFPQIKPTWLGKVTTAAQVILLVAVLLELTSSGLFSQAFFTVLFWVVAIMTSLDGASYLWIWTNKLGRDPRWREIF